MDQEASSNKPSGSVHDSPAGIESVSPAPVLQATRRWWKLAVPAAVLLGAAAATAVWFLFEMQYTASAVIRIDTDKFYIAFPSPPRSPEHFLETQLELLHSPMVLNPLLSQPEIATQPEIHQAEDPLATTGPPTRK